MKICSCYAVVLSLLGLTTVYNGRGQIRSHYKLLWQCKERELLHNITTANYNIWVRFMKNKESKHTCNICYYNMERYNLWPQITTHKFDLVAAGSFFSMGALQDSVMREADQTPKLIVVIVNLAKFSCKIMTGLSPHLSSALLVPGNNEMEINFCFLMKEQIKKCASHMQRKHIQARWTWKYTRVMDWNTPNLSSIILFFSFYIKYYKPHKCADKPSNISVCIQI